MSFTEDLRTHHYVRPARGGWLTGTCVAVAAGAGLDVGVVRLLMVLALLVTGGWFVVPYLVAAMVLPRELPTCGPQAPGAPGQVL